MYSRCHQIIRYVLILVLKVRSMEVNLINFGTLEIEVLQKIGMREAHYLNNCAYFCIINKWYDCKPHKIFQPTR